MDIRKLVARRTDLSTFLVHLTRDGDEESASDRLESILRNDKIEARSMFGMAKRRLEAENIDLASQKCVCFTETPLEYIHLLVGPIERRQYRFEPYGVALTKKVGRSWGINPVWYIDMTPGHDWLTRPLDALIDDALAEGDFNDSAISKLTPFIEQMGTGGGYRKEFWWEREWRYVGDLLLPHQILVLCPEEEFDRFKPIVEDRPRKPKFIDPSWGLEEIIGHLAGFRSEEIGVFE